MAVPSVLADEQDMFYDANITLMRATRLEKEQNYKEAVENGKKAAKMLKNLKSAHPDWNPSWVDGKLNEAQAVVNRATPLISKTVEHKQVDLSLKPWESPDLTLERAYEAHKSGKIAAKPYSPPDRPRYAPRPTEPKVRKPEPKPVVNEAPRPAPKPTPQAKPKPAPQATPAPPAPQPQQNRVSAPKPAPQPQQVATPRPAQQPKVYKLKPQPETKPAPVIRSTPTTPQRPYTQPTQRRSGQRSRFRIG